MPSISRFYGITIVMYANDHPPPHVHARYAEAHATFALDGRVLAGSLPRRARQLVRAWARQHPEELELC